MIGEDEERAICRVAANSTYTCEEGKEKQTYM
jgi:hypothetical protein